MWMRWWWVAVAALLAVILPPSNATLSPAGINYEGTYPALLLISQVLTKCPTSCLGRKKTHAEHFLSGNSRNTVFFWLKFLEKSSLLPPINRWFQRRCKRSTMNKNIK
jgi:hypothetical protein